jgi:alpha-beta hydrolase superfamily lysophospholipase
MIAIETSWKSKDNLDMYGQYWLPKGVIKAVVCLVHGLGEHSGRYNHIGEMLTSNGYALYGFDQRGHGKSKGKKGHFPSLESAMEDIDLLLLQAEKQFPGVPKFIYGHSMGGNIALNYLLRRQPSVRGAIITAPWLILDPPTGIIKVALAKIMNSILPSFQDNNGLDLNYLTHDENVIQTYIEDDLVHNKISAGAFLALKESASWALENAHKLSKPVLLMHGDEDKLTSPKGSQEFAVTAGNLVDYKLWEGYYHEIHNEIKKELVMNKMLGWLGGILN